MWNLHAGEALLSSLLTKKQMGDSLQTTGNSLCLMGFTGGFAYSQFIPCHFNYQSITQLFRVNYSRAFSEEGIVASSQ